MKTKPFIIAVSLIALAADGQVAPDRNSLTPTTPDIHYTVADRGQHHRLWQHISFRTNSFGRIVTTTNSYLELATGLHYRDDFGEWQESDSEFELTPEGHAVARRCQHQVSIAPNLNSEDGAVDFQTPDGRRLRSGIIGLNLFDPASGRSLQIAAVRDSIGKLVSPDEIVWTDAFEGFKADVRVRNERSGFHQDVLLREKLSDEDLTWLGFDPSSVRVQVWTEFMEAPAPAVQTRIVQSETNASIRAMMAEPDQVDQRLDFGRMRLDFGSGKAFLEGASTNSAHIMKQWHEIGSRRFLVESASYKELAPLLQGLPIRTASLSTNSRPTRTASNRSPPGRSVQASKSEPQSIKLAKLGPSRSDTPAVILDYHTVNTGLGSFTFTNNATFYLSAPVTASGQITFEGGAVLKYAVNASLTLSSTATMKWSTSPYRPVIFTAINDNSVGETVSTGTPAWGAYANPALSLNGDPPSVWAMANFRIAYAQQAISASSISFSLYISHGQLVHCANGIHTPGQGAIYVRNVLFANVMTAFNSPSYAGFDVQSSTFAGRENWPIESAFVVSGNSWNAPFNVTLKNCVLAKMTSFNNFGSQGSLGGDHNGFDYPNSTPVPFGTSVIPRSSGPLFQNVGAAKYYLGQNANGTDGSGFRNTGTISLDATLLSELRQKTTYPPTVYSDVSITANTFLLPRPIRDTDNIDLGYHYATVDFVTDRYHVSGASDVTLTIGPGTTLAYYNSAGIWLDDRAILVCEGSSAAPNRFVCYASVQEQPMNVGDWVGAACGQPVFISRANGHFRPARFRFTEFIRPATGVPWTLDFRTTFGSVSSLEVTDCAFYGAKCGVENSESAPISFINNLFMNAGFYAQEGATLSVYNNLFNRGSVFVDVYSGSITMRDNAFVACSVGAEQEVLHSRNAYIDTPGRLPPANDLDNVILSSFSYEQGRFGDFYQSGTSLRDAGSRTHSEAGLTYYTTRTSQLREGSDASSTVDIGLHYPADSDGDGLDDIWERQYRLDENSTTGFDGASGDPDGDGVGNLAEYAQGASPVDPDGLANPLALPPVGSRYLRIIAPSLLELVRVTGAGDNAWNFGGSPDSTKFKIMVNGATRTIQQTGFKRRPLYNSFLNTSDLRIENSVYLTLPLTLPLGENDIVEVQKINSWPSGSSPYDWPDNHLFIARNDPLRYGPAIHVNHEGYLPNSSQKAIIGYYCGDLPAPATPTVQEGAFWPSAGSISSIGGSGNCYGPLNMRTGSGLAFAVDSLNAQILNNFSGWLGCRFVVGATEMKVSQLGRWVVNGNSQTHTVKLVNANGTDLSGGAVTVNTAGALPGSYAWASLLNPVTLGPGATYYVLSSEVNGGDYWYNYDCHVSSPGFGQIDFEALGNSSVKLVDVSNGAVIPGFSPVVTPATEYGGVDSSQYQGLLQVDLNGFSQLGEYRLQVDGLGASFPFRIEDAVSMKFARTYALGLYHQRCGAANSLPFTRFTHDACHVPSATVLVPQNSYPEAWAIISKPSSQLGQYGGVASPDQKAPLLNSVANVLFPFSQALQDGKDNGYEVVNASAQGGQGRAINVSGGHHDAGDYSKYTMNSAHLIHTLVFAADNFPNVAALDNLGIPESGDGKSDILREAKVEADFLLKMQDRGTLRDGIQNAYVDGGFYTLVYPKNREYETDVLPDRGDPQIVWPKTTSVTAAAVAALAEIGSSQTFCNQFDFTPNVWDSDMANPYLAAAKRGWDFLMRALDNSYPQWQLAGTIGKDNCYQHLYPYGDVFVHNDELAWAAAAMFAAGYVDTVHNPDELLRNWFPRPDDPTVGVPFSYTCVGDDAAHNNSPCTSWYYGWWGLHQGYGCAIRDYAFAASSGRRNIDDLNSQYLDYCSTATKNWGHIVRSWSENNAYRTALASGSAGYAWEPQFYFPGYWAFDIAVADLLDTTSNDHTRNSAAVISSLNFEAGCNPNNVGFLPGLGWRRHRVVPNQYYWNAGRVFPPTGNPVGSVNHFQDSPSAALKALFYPAAESYTTAGFALYDRWTDASIRNSEFVSIQTARSLTTGSWLAAQSQANRSQQWTAANITAAQGAIAPIFSVLTLNTPQMVQLTSSLPLSQTRIVWDLLGNEPAFGSSFSFAPATVGENRLLQAEAVFPDGRRVFASRTFAVYDPVNGGTECSPDPSIVALYHFDTDLTTDAGSHNYTLTVHDATQDQTGVTMANNTTWMRTYPNSGKVARFKGGSYLEVTGIDDLYVQPGTGPSSLTVEAWIYPRAYSGYHGGIVFLKQDSTTQWGLFYEQNQTPNAPAVWANTSKIIGLDNNGWSQKVALNTWHKLVVTFDTSGTTRAYIDGVLAGQCSNCPPIYNLYTDWTLTIGNFDGDIDEVRISNCVRGPQKACASCQ